jgi:hypothetical protein
LIEKVTHAIYYFFVIQTQKEKTVFFLNIFSCGSATFRHQNKTAPTPPTLYIIIRAYKHSQHIASYNSRQKEEEEETLFFYA